MTLARSRWLMPVADRMGSPEAIQDWGDASYQPVSPRDFGASELNTGAQNAVAFQAALQAAVATGAPLAIPAVAIPGQTWKCNQLTDVSGGRLAIVGEPGAVLEPTQGTWLKVVPAGPKFGVVLRDLVFKVTAGVAQTPIVWLEGSSAGGVVDVSLDNLDFGDLTNQSCDLIWMRAAFNGSAERIWCNNGQLCRGILFSGRDFNSGNIDFDTIVLGGIGVGLQLGQAFNNANQALLNTIEVRNLKVANFAPSLGCFQEITLTAQATQGDGTLTVGAADATKVANALAAGTPQFIAVVGNSICGDMIRAVAAVGTTITLATTVPQTVPNGTVLPVGSFGAAILTNTRGVTFQQPHWESVGTGLLCATAFQVTVIGQRSNADGGTFQQIGCYASFGTQDVYILQPIISNGGTVFTGLLVTNQGTNQRCQIVEPAFYAGGGGPAAVFTDQSASLTGKQNRFIRMASGQQSGVITFPGGGGAVTPDESFDTGSLTVTDGVAFNFNAPTNRCDGRIFAVIFKNTSGGAMGVITFNALYKLAGAFVAPLTGNQRTYVFRDDGGGNIHEVSRTPADVVN